MSNAKAIVEQMLRKGELLINIATSTANLDTVRVEALRQMNKNVRDLGEHKNEKN